MDTLSHNAPARAAADTVRTAQWNTDAVAQLLDLPFNDLLFRAQSVHREHFDANAVQLSTLLSIKTGGCPEDCGYCPQAARYHTGVENEELLAVDEVVAAARAAQSDRARRASAWAPRGADRSSASWTACSKWSRRCARLGMETCATLGMLKDGQAEQLKDAGLDYYNHNLDTAPEFYGEIIIDAHAGRPARHAGAACAMPACTCAAAASSAWARRAARARR